MGGLCLHNRGPGPREVWGIGAGLRGLPRTRLMGTSDLPYTSVGPGPEWRRGLGRVEWGIPYANN
jgi:hypothetical protein